MKQIEDLWQFDISEDIINGNICNLQNEYNKGWNVNEPLVKYAIEGKYVLPLMLSIQHNNLKSVIFLVEHGAELEADPDHAFIFAMRYADEEVIRYVVSQGAKVQVYSRILNAYDFIIQEKRTEFLPLAIELGLPIRPFAQAALYKERFIGVFR